MAKATILLLAAALAAPCHAVETETAGSLSAIGYTYGNGGPHRGTLRGKLFARYSGDMLRAQLGLVTELADTGATVDRAAWDINADSARAPALRLGESFVQWQGDNDSVKLGTQLFSWGTADTVNPVDQLNARDFGDMLDDRKIPVAALEWARYLDSGTLRLVVTPGRAVTRAPTGDNRWVADSGGVPLVDARHTESDQFTSAVMFQNSTDGWDYFFSALHGPSVYPSYSLTLPGGHPTVGTDYPTQTVVGSGFIGYLGKLGVRGEAALFRPDHTRTDTYWQGVVGVDYTWNGSVIDSISTNLQYAWDSTLQQGDGRAVGAIKSLGRIFRHHLLVRTQFTFDQQNSVRLRGAYDVRNLDWVLRLSYRHRFDNNLLATIGGDYLRGGLDTFFGQYRDNSRLFLKLEKSF